MRLHLEMGGAGFGVNTKQATETLMSQRHTAATQAMWCKRRAWLRSDVGYRISTQRTKPAAANKHDSEARGEPLALRLLAVRRDLDDAWASNRGCLLLLLGRAVCLLSVSCCAACSAPPRRTWRVSTSCPTIHQPRLTHALNPPTITSATAQQAAGGRLLIRHQPSSWRLPTGSQHQQQQQQQHRPATAAAAAAAAAPRARRPPQRQPSSTTSSTPRGRPSRCPFTNTCVLRRWVGLARPAHPVRSKHTID